MSLWQTIKRPPWRTIIPLVGVLIAAWLVYLFWSPGLDVLDGRDDRGRNAMWLSHGWLGGDEWFIRNGKTNEFQSYRDPQRIRELAQKLRRHHITDVFPHLCSASSAGRLPPVDAAQVERFLDELAGIRVIPWIGGPNESNVLLDKPEWRSAFITSACQLLAAHPRLAGVQINIEPLPSGDTNFLNLLEELRVALPKGKLLSVAAYPPPTMWHPHSDVHWDEKYFREVARRSDQLAVMTYDAGQRLPKLYQSLMASWTKEVISWSDGTPVLIGVPTYKDAGVGYHRLGVENMTNAMLGIHRGLAAQALPTNYQGIAIYCEWETSETEWQYLCDHFLAPDKPAK